MKNYAVMIDQCRNNREQFSRQEKGRIASFRAVAIFVICYLSMVVPVGMIVMYPFVAPLFSK